MVLHRDISRLEAALLDLYAPGLETGNYPERIFALLGRLFESELLGLMIRDTVTASLEARLDRYLNGLERVGGIFSQLGPRYPWFRADPDIHGGKPHCRSDFFSDRQFRDLDIHSEVFRGWGQEHFMSMYLHSEGSRIFFVGFNRGKRDFSPREREIAAMARPHLSTARHLARALEEGKSQPVTPELLVRCGFTPRESEVLYWLTEGKSNSEIATILGIGLPTIKGYVTAIFNKTGAGNRHAVILHARSLAKRVLPQAASRHRAAVHLPYPLPK